MKRMIQLLCSLPIGILTQMAAAAPYEIFFLQNGKSSLVTLPHIWTQNPELKHLLEGQDQPQTSRDTALDLAF